MRCHILIPALVLFVVAARAPVYPDLYVTGGWTLDPWSPGLAIPPGGGSPADLLLEEEPGEPGLYTLTLTSSQHQLTSDIVYFWKAETLGSVDAVPISGSQGENALHGPISGDLTFYVQTNPQNDWFIPDAGDSFGNTGFIYTSETRSNVERATSVQATGDFQSALGGTNWNPADPSAVTLNDIGGGYYEGSVTGLPAGDYQFVITLNESFSPFVSGNFLAFRIHGTSSDGNLPFTVEDPSDEVFFTLDANRARTRVLLNGEPPQPDPVEVTTWEDLHNMREALSDPYVLMNDLGPADVGYNTYNSGDGWQPVGTESAPFTGIFDGQDYTISGLTMADTNSRELGLFGVISGATIQNVNLADVSISWTLTAGGLVGTNSGGTITNSHVQADINGETRAGGLVGHLDGGEVISSSTTGAVTSAGGTGGLVGVQSGGGIQSSLSGSAATTGADAKAGGLIGIQEDDGELHNSYATGSVAAEQHAGGLLGHQASGSVMQSFATGSVSAGTVTGGLAGLQTAGLIQDSYWDAEATGQGTPAGNGSGDIVNVTGLGTMDMRGSSAPTNMTSLDFASAQPEWRTIEGGDEFKDNVYENNYPTLTEIDTALQLAARQVPLPAWIDEQEKRYQSFTRALRASGLNETLHVSGGDLRGNVDSALADPILVEDRTVNFLAGQKIHNLGNIVFSAGSNVTLQNSTTLESVGDFIRQGGTFHMEESARLELSGPNPSTIGGFTDTNRLGSLHVKKSSGSGTKDGLLTAPVTLTGDTEADLLLLTNGLLVTDGFELAVTSTEGDTVADGGSGILLADADGSNRAASQNPAEYLDNPRYTGSGQASSYIVGKLTRHVRAVDTGTPAYYFPVSADTGTMGYAPFEYRPAVAGTAQDFSISVATLAEASQNLAVGDSAIERHWQIEADPHGAEGTTFALFHGPEDRPNNDGPFDTGAYRLVQSAWSRGGAESFLEELSEGWEKASLSGFIVPDGEREYTVFQSVDDEVLRVDLEYFTVRASGPDFQLRWATAAEFDNAGFHVYRATAQGAVGERLTNTLIHPRGTEIDGADYTFTDPVPGAFGETRHYLLEDVEFGGQRTLHGPATATIGEVDLLEEADWLPVAVSGLSSPIFARNGRSLVMTSQGDGDLFGFWEMAEPEKPLDLGDYELYVALSSQYGEGTGIPDVRVRLSTADHGMVTMLQSVDVPGREHPTELRFPFSSDGVSEWFVAIDMMAFLGQSGNVEIREVRIVPRQ